MTIYWLLLAVPAWFALSYTPRPAGAWLSAGDAMAMLGFVLFYFLVSLLRDAIGGDWTAYVEMYEQARLASLTEAPAITDPGFGVLLWLSAQLGGGLYLVDGLCSLLLAVGVIRVALRTSEPWLAILVAVPYLLIVVGMGYVRQAAAIGVVLLAIANLADGRPVRTVLMLIGGALFHSTSVVVWPFFAFGLANRNRLRIITIAVVGSVGLLVIILQRLPEFQAGYIDIEYDSSGALVRLLMGLLPSLLLLLRVKAFTAPERVRGLWIGFALANIAGLLAYFVSPSSTAVDRLMLYFSVVQLVTFGELPALLGFSKRSGIIVRMLALTYSVAVLFVWMVFAAHAEYWVPYKSVLRYL